MTVKIQLVRLILYFLLCDAYAYFFFLIFQIFQIFYISYKETLIFPFCFFLMNAFYIY